MNPFLIAQMRKRMEQHKFPSGGYPPGYGWGFWLIGGFVLLGLVAVIVLLSLRQAAP